MPEAHTSSRNTQSNQNRAPHKRNKQSANRSSRSPIYGALDLGTNNCRLLLASRARQGFRILDAFSRIVRLGEGVNKSGVMTDEAMDRTIEALKVCAEKIKRRGVTHMRSVATEACRLAENSNEFVNRVWDETGIAIDVITAEEEARLAVIGCQGVFDKAAKKVIVFDIGGGSTEITAIERVEGGKYRLIDWASIPFGVVRLSESIEGGARNMDDYKNVISDINAHLGEFSKDLGLSKDIDAGHVQLVGSSGTVTTLAAIHIGLDVYDRKQVDGLSLNSNDIRDLSRDIAKMDYQERINVGCIGEERADLVVGGCAIFEGLLSLWPTEKVYIADRGIREGVLRSLMEPSPFVQNEPLYAE